MKNAKVFTIINFVLSGFLWLLGILTLLFNILGLWTPWHLAGFAFIFYIPIAAISQLLSFVFSCIARENKLVTINSITFFISLGFLLFTILVYSNWFWWISPRQLAVGVPFLSPLLLFAQSFILTPYVDIRDRSNKLLLGCKCCIWGVSLADF